VHLDYIAQNGRRHLAWSSVYDVGEKEGAQGLTLKSNHTTFGISVEISSDSSATSLATNPATSQARNPATATSMAMKPGNAPCHQQGHEAWQCTPQ
jgi:hypothetical protein